MPSLRILWSRHNLILLVAVGAMLGRVVTVPARAADPVIDMARPAGWGPVALAIVQLRTGKVVPDLYYCPPLEDGQTEENMICLGASYLDHPGHVVRLLAQSPEFVATDRQIFRRIGGHAARRGPGGRVIALLENTDSGYVWMPWFGQIEHGTACLPTALIARFALVLPANARGGENGERCFAP